MGIRRSIRKVRGKYRIFLKGKPFGGQPFKTKAAARKVLRR